MATFYARLLNQCKFEYHIWFWAAFYKINEDDQRSDEIEISNNLIINLNLTETDIKNTDVKSQLEHHFRIQETKESDWIFEKI